MAISESYSTSQLKSRIDDLSVLYDFDELDRDELVAGGWCHQALKKLRNPC